MECTLNVDDWQYRTPPPVAGWYETDDCAAPVSVRWWFADCSLWSAPVSMDYALQGGQVRRNGARRQVRMGWRAPQPAALHACRERARYLQLVQAMADADVAATREVASFYADRSVDGREPANPRVAEAQRARCRRAAIRDYLTPCATA